MPEGNRTLTSRATAVRAPLSHQYTTGTTVSVHPLRFSDLLQLNSRHFPIGALGP